MTEHQLLLFMVGVTVLFLAARIGGELAARLRIPLNVGELLIGILIGPSLLGWLWPEAFAAISRAIHCSAASSTASPGSGSSSWS